MRVIAGTARHLALKTIEGMDTRPTTDRIKETLFNMIQNDLQGCRFLDLFSGSGAIGIEALSRGAAECTFVENSRSAAACIRENLAFTHLADRACLLECDVFAALEQLKKTASAPYDFIFMDPPYRKDLEKQVLEVLSGSSLADGWTTIITEASLDTGFSYLDALGFRVRKEKCYKTNKHVFITIKE